MENINVLKRLPANLVGNDYVIGDVHGMVETVDFLLLKVNFDQNNDRLFLVGDLADRGPKSMESLRLLNRPYVHCVMGNHELMLITAVLNETVDDFSVPDFFCCSPYHIVQNGGKWLFGNGIYSNWLNNLIGVSPDFPGLMEKVMGLPLAIAVGDSTNRFNITHAEFPRRWTDVEVDALPETMPVNDALAGRNVPDVWSRDVYSYAADDGKPYEKKPSLSTTYVGHTIVSKPKSSFSHIFIDGGAAHGYEKHMKGIGNYKKYGLTIINAKTGCFITADADLDCTSGQIDLETHELLA